MTEQPVEIDASEEVLASGPIERFEWERIIRRVSMPPTVKLMALTLATYADMDGTRVRPGVDRLIRVTGTSLATVKRTLSWLREHGLIERVKQGNRWAGHADEYQLSIPVNLLDMDLLMPDERTESGSHP
ncbi:hypothetical protein [Rhodococcus sp. ARP2]|uniref:hypothetical protein n=1 Tax=Rhodococcus sp. ARP2 TaxID=1661385 RepID=UPI00064B81AF|nr:hypothetical protein [Rhodococcus sp. ARP2]